MQPLIVYTEQAIVMVCFLILKYEFDKIQEILGDDLEKGLVILEQNRT